MYQLSIDFLLQLSKSYLIPMICFSLIKSFPIKFLVQILKFLILSSVNADMLFVFNMAIDKEYIHCTYYCTRLQYTVCIDIVDYLVIVDDNPILVLEEGCYEVLLKISTNADASF